MPLVLAGVEPGGVAGIFLSIPVVAALSVAWRHGLVWLDEGQRSVQSSQREVAMQDVWWMTPERTRACWPSYAAGYPRDRRRSNFSGTAARERARQRR